jgi:hypothetical protein
VLSHGLAAHLRALGVQSEKTINSDSEEGRTFFNGNLTKETAIVTENRTTKDARLFPLGAPWRSKYSTAYEEALNTRFSNQKSRGVDYLHRTLDRQINKARGLLTYNALLLTSINTMVIAHSPRGTVPMFTPFSRIGLILALVSCLPLLLIFYVSWGTAGDLGSDEGDFSNTLLVLRRRTYLLTLSLYATLAATIIALDLVITLT